MQNRIEISRIYQDDCTLGLLVYNGFRCFTLELPWLNNKKDKSCIPHGLYKGRKIVSEHLGPCIEILNVLDRELIRIHSGNFTSEILGCILAGEYHKDINRDGIIDVANSKATLEKLMQLLPDEFEIEIK